MNKVISGRGQTFGRLNQSFALLEHLQNSNSCEWLELDKELDAAILREAAQRVIARHPMAQSVYKRGWFRTKWIHTDRQLPIEIERQSWGSDSEDDIQAKMFENISEYSVLREDKHPFRFIMIKTPSRCFLQVLTTHVYTDGRSANIFTHDLMDCYNCLWDGNAWSKPLADISNRNHDHMFLADVPLSSRFKYFIQAFWGLIKDLFVPSGKLNLGRSTRDCTALHLTKIPDYLVRNLKHKAKLQQVSLHAMFLLALVRTIQAFNEENSSKTKSRIRILDNFSLRRFSDHESIDELYDCIAVPYVLKTNLKRTDKQIMEGFNRQLTNMKAGGALRELYKYRFYYWMSLPIPKKLAGRIAASVMVRANVICTNVGILNPALTRFGDSKILSYISFPALLPPGDTIFQLSTYRGSLRLLTLYHRDQLTESKLQLELVSVFVKKLSEIAHSSTFSKTSSSSMQQELKAII